ncbi:hypothetical protein FQZ97_694570 [compost metagenome]
MMSVTRRTDVTISCMVAPAASTWSEPTDTFCTESSIKPLISLAAAALRWARARTSLATTAKPLPCSPARAASTAAFSARMLVWKAMPSITPTMSAMRLELSAMPRIVPTTSPTARPPRVATSEAAIASSDALRELSALLRTVDDSSSMLAAVSSRDAACCSVREDRSMLPAAISREPVWISSTPRRTADTVRARLSCMRLTAPYSTPISLLPRCSMRLVRSPAAMRSNRRPASCSGRKTERANTAYSPTTRTPTTISRPTSSAIAPLMLVEASRATRWPTSSA